MLSKGWNRERLLKFGERVVVVVGCIVAACALAWIAVHSN